MKTQAAYLLPGDTVLLIAPSRSVSKADVVAFSRWVDSQGWKLEYSPNLFEVEHQFAGSDQHRAEDVIWATTHPTAKAIFTARGGYGCVRTVSKAEDLCDAMQGQLLVGDSMTEYSTEENAMKSIVYPDSGLVKLLKHSPAKWLVGFSDITWLHLLFAKANLQSIHGPVATQWNLTHGHIDQNISHLAKTLMGDIVSLDLSNSDVVRSKPFTGEVVGGNLSLLYASLGTPFQPNTAGKALFIEDLDEYYYHIDRMLFSLKLAGLFDGIKGLLVGSMIDMNDNGVPFGKSVKSMITELLSGYNFPIIFDVPVGHDEENISIKLGAECTFENSILTQ
ncbi:peptidase S66 [Bacteroidota bacterium]|nr:peptidase S66 [Bacteroidota bacterium]